MGGRWRALFAGAAIGMSLVPAFGAGPAAAITCAPGSAKCIVVTVVPGGNGTGFIQGFLGTGAGDEIIHCERAGGITSGLCQTAQPTATDRGSIQIAFHLVSPSGSTGCVQGLPCNDGTNVAIFTYTSSATETRMSFQLLDIEEISMSIAGTGSGTVTSDPRGIDCLPTCVIPFALNSTVVLTAHPAAGSAFTGWSGDCSGSGPCELQMIRDFVITATFGPAPTAAPTPAKTPKPSPSTPATAPPSNAPSAAPPSGAPANSNGSSPEATTTAGSSGAATLEPPSPTAAGAPSTAPSSPPNAVDVETANGPAAILAVLLGVILLVLFGYVMLTRVRRPPAGG